MAQDFVNVYLYQMYYTVGINERIDWNPALDGFLWLGNAKLK